MWFAAGIKQHSVSLRGLRCLLSGLVVVSAKSKISRNRLCCYALACGYSRSMSAAAASAVSIDCDPSDGVLIDVPIAIRVRNLPPNQHITFHNLVNNDGKRFGAYAHYIADVSGTVDLTRDRATGGSYTGVQPMGVFTHMVQTPGQKRGRRLFHKHVHLPVISELAVYMGHLDGTQMYTEDGKIHERSDKVSERLLHRYYMSEDVTRSEVKVGNVRGALFTPKSAGPHPGVVDMFGTVGGLTQFRSALLASHGYASLALAYFGYDDLPETFDVDLTYFEEAAQWLSQHPMVQPGGVAVIGVSRGGQMAASMYAHFPQYVKAAVCINGNYFHWRVSYKGQPMGDDTLDKLYSKWEMLKDGLIGMPNMEVLNFLDVGQHGEFKDSVIPVERGRGEVMYIAGTRDGCVPAVEMARLSCRRLARANRNNYHLLEYEGAGHLIEPPYAPLCPIAYMALFNSFLLFGGEVEGHARAQEHSWRQILQFLSHNLQPTTDSTRSTKRTSAL